MDTPTTRLKILIMGLPGSGKTRLAGKLFEYLSYEEGSCSWLNADAIRDYYDDWDFSLEGRIRQAHRMHKVADECDNRFIVCDFIAPLPEMREIFDADVTIWMDTISEGRFEDTNKIFTPPEKYDFRFKEKNADKNLEDIVAFLQQKGVIAF